MSNELVTNVPGPEGSYSLLKGVYTNKGEEIINTETRRLVIYPEDVCDVAGSCMEILDEHYSAGKTVSITMVHITQADELARMWVRNLEDSTPVTDPKHFVRKLLDEVEQNTK